jgi:hypothetical protein
MFSFPNLRCEDHSKNRLGRQLIFHVFCEICGSDSEVLVKCPAAASAFTVSTQRCRSHFFIGKGSPRDRRSGDMLVTRPQIAQGCVYAESHHIRVIARVLVRANQLTPIHNTYLEGWIEASPGISHSIPETVWKISLQAILSSCPGEIRAFVQNERRDLIDEDKGVVALVWVSSRASQAISMAQFYE